MIKKILAAMTIISFIYFVSIPTPIFAANTYSIDLDPASSQYLSITDANQSAGLKPTGDFSWSAWVKWETISRNNTIMARWTASSYGIFIFQPTATNKLQFRVIDSSGNTTQYTSNTSLSAGTWYHLGGTFDASAATMVLYKDGAVFPSTADSQNANAVDNASAEFQLGARNGGLFYDGLLDEVTFWSDIRTLSEFQAEYNSGAGKIYTGSEAGLEGYWRMENDLLDETANNNDLTNNNSAVFSTDVPFTGAAATEEVSNTQWF